MIGYLVIGGLGALFFGFIIHMACRTKPLFRMSCYRCGHKDKEWRVVPSGHDDFTWQHDCRPGGKNAIRSKTK